MTPHRFPHSSPKLTQYTTKRGLSPSEGSAATRQSHQIPNIYQSFFFLLLLTLPLTSCVDRKIRITSEPPGARVWLNDTEIGSTPAEADFTYYGRYDVRLELDGYEPLWTDREAKAPVWQWPGPDLVAEVIPLRFDDVVDWHFELAPALEFTAEPDALKADLLTRARDLKDRTAVTDD